MKNKKYLFLLLIIPVLVMFISRSFSLTYNEVIESVEIQSNNYDDPGSWHIKKSAEWTGLAKARVTFDVNSVMKTIEGRYKDVIFVIDVSGSMSGSKLERARQDAIDLTNYILSDSQNRVALITFGYTSRIISGFTNNKDEMVNYITNLSSNGSTNYNAGLLNVDTVMRNYVKSDNKDLVLLFLTDGYPNEDTPNQVATYKILKEKYPYMTISGIQYEMGKNIIKEIIEISDNQFIADKDTLNNVLFEASVSPMTYDNFVITDYIDNEYFYVDSIDDIEVSVGNAIIEDENGSQKITWNLGNYFISGNDAHMFIDVKLKENYYNTSGYYPTNKKETIVSKLPDEDEKTKTSELTPVLKNGYKVIYDTNTPSGCNLEAIPTETYPMHYTVIKRNDNLSCPGYIFKGWKITQNSTSELVIINDNQFIMPSHDVTIKGTWTKQNMYKTMDGTVKENTKGNLRVQDDSPNYTYSTTFGMNVYRSSFESITIVDRIDIPENAIRSADVSDLGNGTVMAWYTDVDGNSKYELYIGGAGGVNANSNSTGAFSHFSNVKSYDLTYLDTSKVENMSAMFAQSSYSIPNVEFIGLESWDTSKVTNMSNMFYETGYRSTSLTIGSLGSWNVSKVTNMNHLFYRLGYNSTNIDIGDLSNWNVSNVTNMNSLFGGLGRYAENWSVGDLSRWDVSKVTDMGGMFYQTGREAPTWSVGDISRWNVSNVTYMADMFEQAGYSATNFTLDLSNWDVSKVTDMSYIFRDTGHDSLHFELNLTNWKYTNTPNIVYMMFYYAGANATSFKLIGLDTWNTSAITNMRYMFCGAGQNATEWDIGDISNWNTGNVTNMSYMFSYAGSKASSFELDLSRWDVSKVTYNGYMFENAAYNAENVDINLSNWDNSSITSVTSMFNSTGANSKNVNINLSNWNNSATASMTAMFRYIGEKATTVNLNLSNWNNASLTSTSDLFYSVGSGATSVNIDLSNWSNPRMTNYSNLFKNIGYNGAGSVTMNLSNWQNPSITSLYNMFYAFSSYFDNYESTGAENIKIIMTNFDTSNVTTTSGMFNRAGYIAEKFELIGLDTWDMSKVTNMSSMFADSGHNASTWNIGDLSNWDTSNVTNMTSMFEGAGYNATTWNNIGILKTYATNISRIFNNIYPAKATLNIYSDPTTYTNAFTNTSTKEGSEITVNYSSAVTNIDDIIATKSSDSNVVKGSRLD